MPDPSQPQPFGLRDARTYPMPPRRAYKDVGRQIREAVSVGRAYTIEDTRLPTRAVYYATTRRRVSEVIQETQRMQAELRRRWETMFGAAEYMDPATPGYYAAWEMRTRQEIEKDWLL